MYGGFDVFKVYLAVKLHFTSNYNYFDYDGKVNCKLETFTKRNDRYFFHKLSKKYGKDEILDFFVSNFCENDKKWVGNLLQNDGRETYLNYKKHVPPIFPRLTPWTNNTTAKRSSILKTLKTEKRTLQNVFLILALIFLKSQNIFYWLKQHIVLYLSWKTNQGPQLFL